MMPGLAGIMAGLPHHPANALLDSDGQLILDANGNPLLGAP